MAAVGTEVFLILALVVLNGIFSMTEMAMIAAKKPRLRAQAERGSGGARAALALMERPERFLSAVQIGITLVGVLSGAFAGATLAEELAGPLARLPFVGARAEGLAVGIVVAVVTFLSLVFGELIPKQIALGSPEAVAARMARPMTLVTRLSAPFVWLLSASSRVVLRLLGIAEVEEGKVTDEDVRLFLREGTESGVFEKTEGEILERTVRLDERRVDSVMTRRADVEWIDLGRPLDESRALIARTGRAFYPVCRGALDEVVGLLSVRRLWTAQARGEPFDVESHLVQPLYVPPGSSVLRLLETVKAASTSVALVVDEHGGIEGIVTMNDVLEAIVGEVAPISGGEEDVVRREDGSLLVDAMLSIEDAADRTGVPFPAGARGEYQSVAGFVLHRMQRLPAIGDHFEEGGYRFEVIDMDGRRIDRILVGPAADGAASPADPPPG